MSDFKIVSKNAKVDTCYGLETFYITKEEMAALLSGKKLYSTVNCGEYAITIIMKESEEKMESGATALKIHPCYCGGEMEIKKVPQNGGMDGTYWNWELICKKCGLTMTYAADGFYGRKYKTFEEVVDDWNKKKEKFIKTDVLDKFRAEIEKPLLMM